MQRHPGSERYTLSATFEDRPAADAAASAVRDAGLELAVTVDTPRDERAALDAEMRDEIEATTVGAGNVGPFTKGMSKGLAIWVPIGTVAGVVIGLLFGFLPWPNVSTGLRFAIWGVVGGVAGATAGFVIGGLARPRTEHEGESLDAEESVTLGVHSDDPAPLDRAREILERHGAKRVTAVGPSGPRGPSDEDVTRPVRGETPT